MQPLGGLRIIDMTDERGALCGRVLADLGADVIYVEPPSGSPFRQAPSFPHPAATPPRASARPRPPWPPGNFSWRHRSHPPRTQRAARRAAEEGR